MVAQSVAEVLDKHVILDLEGIDRLYLNAYVPLLQSKYFNAVRNHSSALVKLKSLSVKADDLESPDLTGYVYLEMANTFLGLKKIEEAHEYYLIAR